MSELAAVFEAEADEAMAEQNALLAQEHCGPLLQMAAKLGLPVYRLGSDLTIGGCVVSGGCIQRFGCVLYAFSIIIEPFDMGRVVSKIQVFDISGLEEDEGTGKGRSHRIFVDPARGKKLEALFSRICLDRSRVVLAYERADIDEKWTLTSAEINQRVSAEIAGEVGSEFNPEFVSTFVSTFVFIPVMLKKGSTILV